MLHSLLGRLARPGVAHAAAGARASVASGVAAPWRDYHFGSSAYDGAMAREGIVDPDVGAIRAGALAFLDGEFDAQRWYDDPMTTILRGETLGRDGCATVATTDAFGRENGLAAHATAAQVDAVIAHVAAYAPPKTDWRAEVRALEAEIFARHSGLLIGNQAMDFGKQDGVTEIEESLQANEVERRLCDQLLADERAGAVDIDRAPAYVACVSNFTNFLDLCRKVLRNVELGVPVVVLSRDNTAQHMYRWAQLLTELMPKHGVDAGLVSFACFSRDEQRRLFESGSGRSPILVTSSREVAAKLVEMHGNVLASTGGPNTLIATELTPAVAEAIALSATIENSGQCTALRHAIVNCDAADVEDMFAGVASSAGAPQSLADGAFAGIFDFAGEVFKPAAEVPGYTAHPTTPHVAYRLSQTLPPDDIEEQWRNVYVDVTAPGHAVGDDAFAAETARWLVKHQPITLAVNGDDALAKRLFETTGQVVYTVGTLENPALTCQARPQDGEVFGEFPVRRELRKHTKFPMVVPSPQAAYNAHYNAAHLDALGGQAAADVALPPQLAARCAPLLAATPSARVRGYLAKLAEYLADACADNPKRGHNQGARTALYGLQTTPLNGQENLLRCGAADGFDDVAPFLLPFHATSASAQLRVSVAPGNDALVAALGAAGVEQAAVAVEDDAAFAARVEREDPFNVITPALEGFPLVGQFVSTLFCVGHIKSTTPNDDAFVRNFSDSPKWLKIRSA